MAKHQNKNDCDACLDLIVKYPGFHQNLKAWFLMMRGKFPVLHCSEAGRGQARQILMYQEKKSRARFGESAHSWGCAIDVFIMAPGLDLYDRAWFEKHFAPEVPDFLEWYGAPGSKFYERAHVQVRNWKMLAATGEVKLVETPKEIKLA